MPDDELRVDGNAIAGLLREIFTVEMTPAQATCGGCHAVNAVGRMVVYLGGPGAVARCPACGRVLLRIVRGGGRMWLDLSGTACVEVAMPEA
jgi:hypothetical protein